MLSQNALKHSVAIKSVIIIIFIQALCNKYDTHSKYVEVLCNEYDIRSKYTEALCDGYDIHSKHIEALCRQQGNISLRKVLDRSGWQFIAELTLCLPEQYRDEFLQVR